MLGITVCATSMAAVLNSCEKDESKLVVQNGNVDISIASYSELKNVGGAVTVFLKMYQHFYILPTRITIR